MGAAIGVGADGLRVAMGRREAMENGARFVVGDPMMVVVHDEILAAGRRRNGLRQDAAATRGLKCGGKWERLWCES